MDTVPDKERDNRSDGEILADYTSAYKDGQDSRQTEIDEKDKEINRLREHDKAMTNGYEDLKKRSGEVYVHLRGERDEALNEIKNLTPERDEYHIVLEGVQRERDQLKAELDKIMQFETAQDYKDWVHEVTTDKYVALLQLSEARKERDRANDRVERMQSTVTGYMETIVDLRKERDRLLEEEVLSIADLTGHIEMHTKELDKKFTPDDICDMWPHLMKFVEDKKIDELDCDDRYIVKDALEAWRDEQHGT